MATKSLKKGLGDLPDFTYDNVNPTVFVRFNSACVVGLHLDLDNKKVEGVVIDEINEASYPFEVAYDE